MSGWGCSDRALSIEDPDLRYKAIQWRRGTLWFGKTCKICNEKVHSARSHINGCQIIEGKIDDEDIARMHTHSKSNDSSWCAIDVILSENETEMFAKIVDLLNEIFE